MDSKGRSTRRDHRGIRQQRRAARPDLRRWRIEGTILMHEISATAEVMEAFRRLDGGRGAARDGHRALLHVVERAWGTPSIADLARALRVRRQSAHELVRRAEREGLIELIENRRDKRIRQIRLTAIGRSALAAARAQEAERVIELLNGLDMRTIRATAHILRVLRQRLLARLRALSI